jgi:putative tricarboxylic transport membrane protein
MLPYAIVGSAAAYLFYAATQFEFQRRAGTLGPDAWPKLVLGLLIAVCLYEIVRRLASPARRAGARGMLQDLVERSGAAQVGAPDARASRSPLLLVAGIGLTALYVWIIPRVGFVLATAPYLVAFIAVGGYRRWLVNLVVSLAGTLAMMFFFMKVVYVSLPIGQEPFAQVMIGLMRLMGIR